MTVIKSIYRSPLAAQFWLLGLDARNGDLLRRGFLRISDKGLPGSSLYILGTQGHTGTLTLHSSGLWLELPQGTLHIRRSTGLATLASQPITKEKALARIRPHCLEHEAWVVKTYGASWRDTQFQAHKLPAPIRHSLKYWKKWLDGPHGLEAMLWQPATLTQNTALQA